MICSLLFPAHMGIKFHKICENSGHAEKSSV